MKLIEYCKRFPNYCKECYTELATNVTWPTYKELTQSAVVVLTASVIIAICVWVIDLVFKGVMNILYP